MPQSHTPVLFNEAISGLNLQSDGIYVDGTFGRGGHSSGIIAKLGSAGRLIALDKDPAAIQRGKEPPFTDPRFCILHDSFVGLRKAVQERGLLGKVNGILFDLGVSSPQIDEAERGFSFNKEGPLDMRMNPQTGISAADWINQADETEIADVLWRYGEERFSRRIARAIVAARNLARIETTTELSAVIAKVNPARDRRINPATRSFQGIRLFINQELEELREVLEQALEVLTVGGRLCVISFHSLEDRIVKQFIQQHSNKKELPHGLPVREQDIDDTRRLKKINGLIRPTDEETAENPRARSARLRIAEKIK